MDTTRKKMSGDANLLTISTLLQGQFYLLCTAMVIENLVQVLGGGGGGGGITLLAPIPKLQPDLEPRAA